MLLGGSVMQTEMHGSSTEHRGSRLAPLSIRLAAKTDGRLISHSSSSVALNISVLCVSVTQLAYCSCVNTFLLFVFVFLFFPPKLDFGPRRVRAGCSGQQNALPQLRRHAGLRGDAVVQGPGGCLRPGAGPPVSSAVRVGPTLEQPGHRLTHAPLPGPVQLPVQ